MLSDKIREVGRDTSAYCAFDLADELVKDVDKQVWECFKRHEYTFDTEFFCVVMLYASDCAVKAMVRRKFYAWPFLPQPRCSQTVWYCKRGVGPIKMLWALPASDTLATLATLVTVHKDYRNMQRWARWIYEPGFYERIRKEAHIPMLSEEEHLDIVRKKDPKPVTEDLGPTPTNPIDSIKFAAQEVADS